MNRALSTKETIAKIEETLCQILELPARVVAIEDGDSRTVYRIWYQPEEMADMEADWIDDALWFDNEEGHAEIWINSDGRYRWTRNALCSFIQKAYPPMERADSAIDFPNAYLAALNLAEVTGMDEVTVKKNALLSDYLNG